MKWEKLLRRVGSMGDLTGPHNTRQQYNTMYRQTLHRLPACFLSRCTSPPPPLWDC